MNRITKLDPIDLIEAELGIAHEIPFTQYLLPDGRRQPVLITVAPDVAKKARRLIENGLAFECEVLRTGHVSFTITDPDTDEDVDIRLVANGPGVREAIEDMVRSFEPTA